MREPSLSEKVRSFCIKKYSCGVTLVFMHTFAFIESRFALRGEPIPTHKDCLASRLAMPPRKRLRETTVLEPTRSDATPAKVERRLGVTTEIDLVRPDAPPDSPYKPPGSEMRLICTGFLGRLKGIDYFTRKITERAAELMHGGMKGDELVQDDVRASHVSVLRHFIRLMRLEVVELRRVVMKKLIEYKEPAGPTPGDPIGDLRRWCRPDVHVPEMRAVRTGLRSSASKQICSEIARFTRMARLMATFYTVASWNVNLLLSNLRFRDQVEPKLIAKIANKAAAMDLLTREMARATAYGESVLDVASADVLSIQAYTDSKYPCSYPPQSPGAYRI